MSTSTRKTWLLGATATVLSLALAAGGSVAAYADPSSSPRLLNGAGSGTSQDVNNALAAVVEGDHDDNENTPDELILGSWHATGGGAIDTGTGPFARPNGSIAGVFTLKSAKDTTTRWNGVNLPYDALQFARSSVAPSASALDMNGEYYYIPLAADAVTFAVHASNAVIPTDAEGNYDLPLGTWVGERWGSGDNAGQLKLTLKNIYGNIGIFGNRVATLYSAASGGVARTVGSESSSAQIVPFIPQAGSGTRSFWQTTITGSSGTPFGDHVSEVYGPSHASVQAHDGSVLEALPQRAIVPFSVAQHITQTNLAADPGYYDVYGITVTDRLHGAALGEIDSMEPVTNHGTPNAGFTVTGPVFTVVHAAELNDDGPRGTELRATFAGTTGKAYQALRPDPDITIPVIEDFGFVNLEFGADFVIAGQLFENVTAGEVSNRLRANP